MLDKYFPRTLVRDLTIGLIITITFVIFVFIISNYFYISIKVERDLEKRVVDTADNMAQNLAILIWNLDKGAIEQTAKTYQRVDDLIELKITNEKNELIYLNKKLENIDAADTVTAQREIIYSNRKIGPLIITLSKEHIKQEKRILWLIIMATSLVTIAVVISTRFLLKLLLTIPLNTLAKGLDTLASGDYSYRISPTNLNDIDIIARCANAMAKQISERDRELKDLIATLDKKVKERTMEMEVEKNNAVSANRAKSEFLARMSHELRTPLNSIIGFTDIIRNYSQLHDGIKGQMNIIHQSSNHLHNLINDLLDTSKIEAGKMEVNRSDIELRSFWDALIAMHTIPAHIKGLALILDCDSSLPEFITTDEQKLKQILINLIGNAIKFTTQGQVVLKVRYKGIEQDKGKLLVTVQDSGIGIDMEKAYALFDPFKQLSNSQGVVGTGLGLTISNNFVGMLGGDKIHVESTIGIGSIFSFEILVGIANKGKVTQRAPQKYQLADNCQVRKVLVVEDIEYNRILLTTLLDKAGFDVMEAEDGKQGVEMYSRFHPDFIWMDILMPVMDGIESQKIIRQTSGGEKIPIVAVTASFQESEYQDFIDNGFSDVVAKPYQESTIFNCMRDLLGVKFIEVDHDVDKQKEDDELISDEDLNLPEEFLQDSYRLAVEGDIAGLNKLIDQLPKQYSEAKQRLKILTDAFQFEDLIKLLDRSE